MDVSEHDHGSSPLGAASLTRVLGWMAVIAAAITVSSMLLPHEYHLHDEEFVVLAALVALVGFVLLHVGRATRATSLHVHAGVVVLTVFVLVATWLGMRDTAGVQAVYFAVLLAIAGLQGTGRAAWPIAALQSAGYALVLVTAPSPPHVDEFAQWLVVTLSIVLGLVFLRLVRNELRVASRERAERSVERERERALHTERLEHLNAELQHASELKSGFVAMASHELRTPLTSIEGFALTLEERWDQLEEAERRSFVDVIATQSQRLGRLVSDLLAISRIESGRITTRPESVDVARVVADVVGADTGDDVTVEVEHGLRAWVDRDHLEQMLLNYVANARAYGEVPIAVRASKEGDDVVVRVSDAGPGVDPSFVPQLFDRFAQDAGVPRRDGTVGTGLGLSIVKGLAAANDGDAWYEPGAGGGSQFAIRVPARKR